MPTSPSYNKTLKRNQKEKKQSISTTSKEANETRYFFSVRPNNFTKPNLSIHNLSKYTLSTHDVQLLTKGLSFIPTPTTDTYEFHQHILKQFDEYARTLRFASRSQVKSFPASSYQVPPRSSMTPPLPTEIVYRRMKFITPKTQFASTMYSGNRLLEDYIYNTKEMLDKKLTENNIPTKDNLTGNQRKTLKKFQRSRNTITIKPADKNLGLAIMDTEDYIHECTTLLMDNKTYRVVTKYPFNEIKSAVENVCSKFQ